MDYYTTIHPTIVHGNPCKTCGKSLRRRDSGLCVNCNPKQAKKIDHEAIRRRKAIEAHQNKEVDYWELD